MIDLKTRLGVDHNEKAVILIIEPFLVVVFADAEGSGEAEVGDLDAVLGEDQDVPGRQITVDQPLRLQVQHTLQSK